MTLTNAPLVEIIAELRWTPQLPGIVFPPAPSARPQYSHHSVQTDVTDIEAFFSRLGRAVGTLGFSNAERLLPAGLPVIAQQPIYRYRKDESPTLYQVGPGLFSANTTPPYTSWTTFVSDVKCGVEALLASRSELENDGHFTSIALRYIDSFKQDLIGGRSTSKFLEDVFKLKISLPTAISKNIVQDGEFSPVVQLRFPLENGVVMSLVIGEAFENDEQVIVLDSTVATTSPVPANLEAAIATLTNAHDIIHDMFFELTAPIKDLMQTGSGEIR